MVFSSLTFVFIFLLFTALLYFILPGIRLKNAVLLLASLIFYSWAEPRLLLLLLADTLVAYLGGLLIAKYKSRAVVVKQNMTGKQGSKVAKHSKSKKHKIKQSLNPEKIILAIVIVLIVGALVYFKYFGFITEILAGLGSGITIAKIVLPTGISFYTFQILSYVIDLYRRKVALQKNFFRLLLYVSFFPQLIAGPIVRYDIVEEEIGLRHTSLDDAEYGLKRFIIGLFKKVVLANGVAKIAEIIYAGDPYVYGSAFYWLAALAYTFQIYFDFCGYSDMAIGLGRIFGFHFAENFDYPYLSSSVSEFWSKWHISLSTWFRDYVYIPLGGNRVAKARWIFNFMCVWLLTGLWHGASYNFILWGLYYGIVLLLEKSVAFWWQDRKARRMAEDEAESVNLNNDPEGVDFSYSGFSFEAKYGSILYGNSEKGQSLNSAEWLKTPGITSLHKETEEQAQLRDLNEMLYGAPAEPEEIKQEEIKQSEENTVPKLKVLLPRLKERLPRLKELFLKTKAFVTEKTPVAVDAVARFEGTKPGQIVFALVGWLYTMFVVVIGWVLFNLEDLGKVGTAFKTMFGGLPADIASVVAANTEILRGFIFFPLCIVCIFPLKKLLDKLDKTPAAILSTLIYLALFVLCIGLCIAEKYNPFIYFRF